MTKMRGDAPLNPITADNNVVLEKQLAVDFIIANYRRRLSIDVGRFFEGIKIVSIYRCIDSGYRFYFPFKIYGDGEFYKHLQQFSWYYMPWKWEHSYATSYIKPGLNILEVGCGNGGFLKTIRETVNNVALTGLELNEDAVLSGRENGLNILSEKIEEHAETHCEEYDIVCSFQVLEHIEDVRSFLQAKVAALKSGGKLIIGVPNSDSFTKHDWENDILNMPPHHMGLWDKKSLKSLAKVLPLRVVAIKPEPLQTYHRDWYLKVLEGSLLKIGPSILSIYRRLGVRKLMVALASRYSGIFSGHTIVAVFEKT